MGVLNKDSDEILCPLEKVSVDAKIDRDIAHVIITQDYIYKGQGNIEAIYKFPLIYNIEVVGFNVRVGDVEIEGKIKEKEMAYKIYEEAIRKGQTGFLLESHNPDIFQVSLGNLNPNERITVRIDYIEDLSLDDDTIRWMLPTVIAPRYASYLEEDDTTDLNISKADYKLDIQVKISDKDNIKKVSSPSHAIELSFDKDDMLVSLCNENEILNRDFIMNINLNDVVENKFVTGKNKYGEKFGLIKFTPELENYHKEQDNRGYIFLLDISESMVGEKIKQAKRALNIALRNLLEGDKFNIIAFNNNNYTFNEELVLYNQDNLKQAEKWLESLSAYGGKEVFEPLEYALKLKKEEFDRVIFLFTDGQVGNESKIFRLVKKLCNGIRIYPFGIDTAINDYFIEELANVGNGLPEFIYPGERIEDKVINQLSRINQPYYSNVKLKNNLGEEIETFPVIPQKLYNGEVYKFIFKYKSEEEALYTLLSGEINGDEQNMKIEKISEVDGNLLGIRWAKENIKYLESCLESKNHRREKTLKEEIVNISVEYGILSTQTSLVAIYKRIDKHRGYIETIEVPINPPAMWNNTEDIQYKIMDNTVDKNIFLNDSIEKPVFLRRKLLIKHISNKASVLKELMLNVASMQNANGSFQENDIKTSYYVMAMLLYKKENKNYTNQIKKAVDYLTAIGNNDLVIYLALKMAIDNNFDGKYTMEKINFIELNDELSNFRYIYNILNTNINEFSMILFDKNMNKEELIKYLFENIVA